MTICRVEQGGTEKSRATNRCGTRYISTTLDQYLFPSIRATIAEVQERLNMIYERFLEDNNDDLACAKILMSRGLAATAGVEGFYGMDGIKVALIIMLRPESPTDVVGMFLLMKVGS